MEACLGGHYVLDPGQQFPAEGSTGVEEGEILGAEPPEFRHHPREGIPESELEGGAAERGQVQGVLVLPCAVRRGDLRQDAGLGEHRGVENHVGVLGQGRFQPAGYGDDGRPEPAEVGKDGEDLRRGPAVAQDEGGVVPADHTQVAVGAFSGVEEKGGRAQGGEGRGDFPADDPRLSHARHHETPPAGVDDPCGPDKFHVHPVRCPLDLGRLGPENPLSGLEKLPRRRGTPLPFPGKAEHISGPPPPTQGGHAEPVLMGGELSQAAPGVNFIFPRGTRLAVAEGLSGRGGSRRKRASTPAARAPSRGEDEPPVASAGVAGRSGIWTLWVPPKTTGTRKEPHDRQGPHVHHQLAVSHGGPRSQSITKAPPSLALPVDMLQVPGARNWAFFTLRPAGAGRGEQKVRLAARKRRYLRMSTERRRNRPAMTQNAGEHGNAGLPADAGQVHEPLFPCPGPESFQGRAVGLVEGGLEDVVDPQACRGPTVSAISSPSSGVSGHRARRSGEAPPPLWQNSSAPRRGVFHLTGVKVEFCAYRS